MYWRSLVLFATAALSMPAAQPEVTLAPLDGPIASAVTIVLPSDPPFGTSIAKLIPPSALSTFQKVAPYSIIVRNSSPFRIVAVMFRVKTAVPNESSEEKLQGKGDVPPVDKSDFLLAPGDEMLLTPDALYTGVANRLRLRLRYRSESAGSWWERRSSELSAELANASWTTTLQR